MLSNRNISISPLLYTLHGILRLEYEVILGCVFQTVFLFINLIDNYFNGHFSKFEINNFGSGAEILALRHAWSTKQMHAFRLD